MCPETAAELARERLARLGVVALLALCHCTTQQRAESARAASVFACEVAVLAPYVPEAIRAEKLAEQVILGQANLVIVLGRLGMAEDQIKSILAQFNGCFASDLEPLPAELSPEAQALRAPPPAYGNKVL